MEHKIAAVSEKVDTWQSNYGEMKSYYVQFEGSAEAVKINQKPETAAPEVGQVLTGDIVADKFGKKFQKQAQGFSKPSVQSAPNKPDSESMYRCNALNNAVAYIARAGTGLNDPTNDERIAEITRHANDFYDWLANPHKAEARATAESLKPKEDEPEDKEDKSEGEEINLDDIPF